MNKYQEAFDNLKETMKDFHQKTNSEVTNKEFKNWTTLQELIDKQDKYHWHDLLKDPNDLPNIGEKVLCATGNKGGREVQIYRGSHLNSRNESVWKWKHNTHKLPIAWKYIEELKDE